MTTIYDFHRFDVPQQQHPLNPNWTGQKSPDYPAGSWTAPGSDLSAEMKTFYDKVLIRMAGPNLVHDQFGQKRPIPAGNGKIIEFRKFSKLPKALTPLTEGITPAGQNFGVTALTAEIRQYGAYIAMTDMLELTAFDNTMAEIAKMLGDQAGLTSDTITRDVLVAGGNILYPGTASSRATIAKTDVMSVKLIKKAVNKLMRQNAPKINGSYVAIIHPDTLFDLWEDPEWVDASKYAGSTQIFTGEVGKLYGVRFVISTEAKCFGTVGASSAPVYATLVLGENAFGVTSINGGGIETIAKQKGSGGTSDPLNQRSTMGWKMNKAVKILADEYMVRIEHSTSVAGAAAN